jgi:hypothetical protein
MDTEDILHNLESLAKRLSIDVKYQNLSDEEFRIESGACNLKGKSIIIIDKRLPLKEKCRVLSIQLTKYNTDNIFIPPFLRGMIEKEG